MSQTEGLKDIRKHKRVKDMLLGALERPALQWLCEHSPAWLTPDMLTTIGLLGGAISFVGYLLSNQHPAYLLIASFGLLVNWYGDSMDGSLARYRKIERPRYGFFIDHTLDALAQLIFFLGFAISPYARFDVAMVTLIVYYLMDILVLARNSVQGEFKITYGKIGPTEMRTLVVLVNTILMFWSPVIKLELGDFGLFDLVLITVGVSFFGVYVAELVRLSKLLRDLDEGKQAEK
ncbi:MAG TPA: CDP-alcohol phosphatidyltransferase family protein [Anaerolineales bacterium]|nr:CDP-alcohol phosphatidyltransferase family protein [Anaerolineales bacterium]